MYNPNPVNLTTTDQARALGWVAEARDADGHLISVQAWLSICSINENLKMLGEFIAEYEVDNTVTVFDDMLGASIFDRTKGSAS